MRRERAGAYRVTDPGGEAVRAFVPDALPPIPPLALDGAAAASRRLAELFASDRAAIEQRAGRRASSVLRVHEALKERPILSLSGASARTSLSFPTISSAMQMLVERGIARETTGRTRSRLFVYGKYLSILNEGTEAP